MIAYYYYSLGVGTVETELDVTGSTAHTINQRRTPQYYVHVYVHLLLYVLDCI